MEKKKKQDPVPNREKEANDDDDDTRFSFHTALCSFAKQGEFNLRSSVTTSILWSCNICNNSEVVCSGLDRFQIMTCMVVHNVVTSVQATRKSNTPD